MVSAQQTLVVCGGGLAGRMVAAGLAGGLGPAYRIVLLDDAGDARFDAFYGSVSAPTGYDFYRTLGLDEPTLFLESGTTFSYGTQYKTWPGTRGDWLQCHHLPFPVISGVPLQHHLTQQGEDLAPLLVSAQAARAGGFAHPPQDPKSPLSRAEYGYQFCVEEWTSLLHRHLALSRVQRVQGDLVDVETEGADIRSVRLSSGTEVKGDLFIDCTGPTRHLILAAGGGFEKQREIAARRTNARVEQLGPPHRTVDAYPDGWTSTTHLSDAVHTLSVRAARGADDQSGDLAIGLGRMDQAWRGNCVAIGNAAAVLEPLTVAPMMLLQRDIERLLALVPAGHDHSMERREFNRRFDNDVTHAQLFQSAFFRAGELPQSPYWQDAGASTCSEGLDRKIAQFENRGLLVRYDLEPFNDEDWMILHFGMGRRPERHDRQLDGLPVADSARQISAIKQMVAQMVSRLPPHHVYVTNLKRYLEKQAHG